MAEWVVSRYLFIEEIHWKLRVVGSNLPDPNCHVLTGLLMVQGNRTIAMGEKVCRCML